MKRFSLAFSVFCSPFLAISCVKKTTSKSLSTAPVEAPRKEAPPFSNVTPEERKAYLDKAIVWLTPDREALLNSILSPNAPDAAAVWENYKKQVRSIGLIKETNTYQMNSPIEDIICDFKEPEEKLDGGKTPKFKCKSEDGKKHKIRYDLELRTADVDGQKVDLGRSAWKILYHNMEVHTGPVVSKMMSAFQFAANEVNPVNVTCRKCPLDPFSVVARGMESGYAKKYVKQNVDYFQRKLSKDVLTYRSSELVFKLAVEEKELDAFDIQDAEFDKNLTQGWSFDEIYAMGSPTKLQLIERQAFGMILALFQHADAKPEQQRLICEKQSLSADGKCEKPVLMVSDIGYTLGKGTVNMLSQSRFNSKDWNDQPPFLEKFANKPVPLEKCLVNINARSSSAFHPFYISKEGALLASKILEAVSPKQYDSYFSRSRSELVHQPRPDQWTGILLDKINKIAQRAPKCPSIDSQIASGEMKLRMEDPNANPTAEQALYDQPTEIAP